MLESLLSLQFANPAALFAAFAAPLLVFAYLKKRRRQARVVGSVMILRQLQKRKAVRKRFKPPPRFFLELLALLLLAAAAGMPSAKDESNRVAVVLDNSLSMRARNSALAEHPNRFSEARAQAEKWISEQSSDSRFTLYTSGPKLRKISSTPLGASASKRAIRKLEPALTSDGLEAATAELARSGEYEKILVVSDREGDYLPSPSLSQKVGSDKTTYVEVLSVGEPRPNVFIASTRLERDAETKQSSVVAEIGLSAAEPLDIRLRLLAENEEDPSKSDEKAVRRVRVFPGKLTEASLPLPFGKKDQVYKLEIVTSGSESETNSIIEDDFAWVTESRSTDSLLLLVSSESNKTGLGLRALPGFRVVQVTPREYGVLTDDELARFALMIFHRTAPASAPTIPSLLLVSPSNNPLFPGVGEIGSPRVTSWAADHPITSYLKVPLLKPQSSVLIEVPIWGQSIVNAEPGSLVAAGERRGTRFASVGMEILPFEGARTPSSSILMLNLINWLTGSTDFGSNLQSGSALRLEGGWKWVVRTPQQTTETLEVPVGDPAFFAAEQPGAYYVTGFSYADTSSQKQRRIFTVNTQFPDESATYRVGNVLVPNAVVHEEKVRSAAEPLWGFLIALVLAVLLAEYLWFLSRGQVEAAID